MKKIFFYLLFLPCIVSAQEWQYLGLNTENITTIAVDWSNQNIIYAGSRSDFSAGTVGGIFKSTDFGITWDTLIRGVTTIKIVIHPINPNILYATLGVNALTVAGIIKSTDGGTNWIKTDRGVVITWEEGPWPLVLDPKHPDTLYTGTGGELGGRFYRSTNGGMNWYSFGDTTYLRDGVTALAIHPDSTNIIYAGTAIGGNVLKSSDCGANWSLVEVGITSGIIYSIQFSSIPSTIYVGNVPSNSFPVGIFKSTDCGISWSNPKSGLPDTTGIMNIQVLSKNNKEQVFLVTGWGTYQSIDGQKWEKFGVNGSGVSTIMLSERKLYAGGWGVYVMDIPSSNMVDTPPLPNKLKLYDNFPNPFNPSTSIEYEIAKTSIVLLEVFDILGRKIRSLMDKKQSQGKYSVYWNGQDEKGVRVGSGVYFYVLRAGEVVLSKKMIYLK